MLILQVVDPMYASVRPVVLCSCTSRSLMCSLSQCTIKTCPCSASSSRHGSTTQATPPASAAAGGDALPERYTFVATDSAATTMVLVVVCVLFVIARFVIACPVFVHILTVSVHVLWCIVVVHV